MRTIILTRGTDEYRLPVVAQLEKLLNPDVNTVRASLVRFSDYNHLGDKKAAHASVKRSFKLELNNTNRHIVVDAESPGVQAWSGYGTAVADLQLKIIGLDCTEDILHFKPPAAFTMYQNVRESMVEEILKKERLI